MKKGWKSAEEYLHWMQFLEYMPAAAREAARKSFEKGEWPEVEILPPRKGKEKRRLAALLPELILLVSEECSAGEKGGSSCDDGCDHVTGGILKTRQTLLLRAEVFQSAGRSDGNGRIGGEWAGDPAEIAKTFEDGVYIVNVFFAD